MFDPSTTPFRRGILYWIPAGICAYFWVAGTAILGDFVTRIGFGISFFTVGVLVILPAFLQTFPRGLFNVVLAGFFVDAQMPRDYSVVPAVDAFTKQDSVAIFGEMNLEAPEFFGFITGWLIVAFLVLRFLRPFLKVTEFKTWLICAEIVNSAVFVIWAIAFGLRAENLGDYCISAAGTLVASSLVIFVFSWLFFDMMLGAYRVCGIDLIKAREVLDDE